MQGSVDPSNAVWLAGIVVANLGAIMASYVSIKVALTRLETQMGQAQKDIDGLARIIGTKRSKAEYNEGETA